MKIHREHLDPLAPVRGIFWVALVAALVLLVLSYFPWQRL